jgi:hypothetical protein
VDRREEALKLDEQALELARKLQSPEHVDTVNAAHELAKRFASADRHDGAVRILQTSLQDVRKVQGADSLITQFLIHELANACRTAGQQAEADQFSKELANKGITQWLLLAPIPFERGKVLEVLAQEQLPQSGPVRPRAGDAVLTSAGQMSWRAYQAPDHILDFHHWLGKETEWALGYALCYLHSQRDQSDIVMAISTDDQAKVLLNGEEVYLHRIGRRWHDASDRATSLKLRAGANVLLLKILNGVGEWQASINLTDAQGQPLKDVRVTLDPDD